MTEVPLRDCRDLYAIQTTLHCALRLQCIPCAYKVGCFDVALDANVCRAIPNQRPENCPRAQHVTVGEEGTLGFQRNSNILTVGDGDLSFSLALMNMMKGTEGTVYVTSYDSRETLLEVYPGIEERIERLKTLGVKICYKVDAMNIRNTLFMEKDIKFDRIVWNFPCTSISQGQDGQNAEMEHNKILVREFVANAWPLLTENGQIHMAHKTKPPFNQWKIEEVAVESCSNDVSYLGRVVLDRSLFPPYVPRKALDKKSFPCHDACTYIFARRNSSLDNVVPMEANDIQSASTQTLIPITRELLQELRETVLRPKPQSFQHRKKSKYIKH